MKTRWLDAVYSAFMTTVWYGKHPLRWCLYPLALLYRAITACRRVYLQRFAQQHPVVPVIVVGNLTLGGVGKTPLVMALVDYFQTHGLRVGVVTRGYGCRLQQFPYAVATDDEADRVGDEALLLAQNTKVPVVIAPRRIQAVEYLVTHYASEVIISDDGLQHYAMGRAIEIAVIDGVRGLGNGLCLPAGPLREPVSRLQQLDFVIVNSGIWPGAYRMELVPRTIRSLVTGVSVTAEQLSSPVAAVVGIGHPQRFFNTLAALQIVYSPYCFPDHHRFRPEDLQVPESMVIMTEKDAVKCQPFATDSMYVLAVKAQLDAEFWIALKNHPQLTGLGLT